MKSLMGTGQDLERKLTAATEMLFYLTRIVSGKPRAI